MVCGSEHAQRPIGSSLAQLEMPVSIPLMKGNREQHVHGVAWSALDAGAPLVLCGGGPGLGMRHRLLRMRDALVQAQVSTRLHGRVDESGRSV